MRSHSIVVAFAFAFAFAFIGIPTVIATSPAYARKWDNPNYGICKSGSKVANIKNCRENGGSK